MVAHGQPKPAGDRPPGSDAFSLALQALSHKERTVAELGSWLRARGVADPEVAEVVARLVSSGVLDDAEFARRYAEDKRQLQRWGSERIREALLERGVSAADVGAALGDGEQEVEQAVALLLERRAPLEEAPARQRALGLLARRGYDSEVAYEAIRRARRG